VSWCRKWSWVLIVEVVISYEESDRGDIRAGDSGESPYHSFTLDLSYIMGILSLFFYSLCFIHTYYFQGSDFSMDQDHGFMTIRLQNRQFAIEPNLYVI